MDHGLQVLLGETVPPDEADFDDCLEHSVERAIMYLNPSDSSKEVTPETTFEKIDEVGSSLREDIIVDLAPKESMFNFFPDLCPEEPVKKISVVSSEESESAAPSLNGNINTQPSGPAAMTDQGSPVNHASPPIAPKPPHVGQHSMVTPLAESLAANENIYLQPSEPAAKADEESSANQVPHQ